jgi:hypothetical protein
MLLADTGVGARLETSPAILLGTPGEAGRLSECALGLRVRCSGSELVLVKPSRFLVPARDLRWEAILSESTVGVPGTDEVSATSPVVSTSAGFFGRRLPAA